MNTIILNKDTGGTLFAYIDVSGATTNKATARLVLGLESRSLLFDGVVVGNKVTVKYPQLVGIDERTAYVTLEVIVDDILFKGWEGMATLESSKRAVTVNVASVETVPNDEHTLPVEESEEAEEPDVERTEEIVEPTEEPTKIPLIKVELDKKHVRFIKQSISNYDELAKVDKITLKDKIKEYTPTEEVLQWGERSFNNLENFQAKICMYSLQQKITKGKK